jgi:hypothetical protein
MTDTTLLELAQQRFEKLNEFEEQLFTAIEQDRIADYSLSPKSSLKADCISWLLTDSKALKFLTHRGVRVHKCQKILGILNLDFVVVEVPLIFKDCKFTEQISFARAKIFSLQLTGSSVESINAERVKVEHEVCLDSGFESKQEVNLSYGSIGGDLNCIGGKFKKGSKRFALNATAIEVRGHARLNKIEVEGGVSFIAANITHQLNCEGGRFIDRLNGIALIAQSMRVKTLRLSEGFIAEGNVDLSGAFVGSCFTCDGGEFNGVRDQGYALNAERIEVGATVSMMKDFVARGGVNLNCAKIRGIFQCTGQFYNYKFTGNQNLEHDKDYALTAEYAEFASAVYMRKGFEARGRVRLFKAKIGGDLECTGGEFHNPDGSAFDASEAKIDGKVLMDEGFKAEGEVSLIRAAIGSNLNCDKGKFLNANGVALHAECIEIKGTASLKNVINRGILHFLNARIGGNFECDDGQFLYPDGKAINFEGAEIKASVLMRKVTVKGEVNFQRAKIGGALECNDGKFSNDEYSSDQHPHALMLEGVEVGGFVGLRQGIYKGTVRLFKARIGGDLDCDRGQFFSPEKVALNVEAAKISGRVLLNGSEVYGGVSLENTIVDQDLIFNGKFISEKLVNNKNISAINATCLKASKSIGIWSNFYAEGEVCLLSADISGSFQCEGGKFLNPHGFALQAESIKVAGDVFIRNGAIADGKVRLSWSNIGGDLDCNNVEFRNLSNHSDEFTLQVTSGVIKGDVKLNNFIVDGGVSLFSITVGGNIDCGKSSFSKLGGTALGAENAKVDGDFSMNREFKSEGRVNLEAATVNGNLICSQGQFFNAGGIALNAERLKVMGSALLKEKFIAKGEVRFLNARIGGNLECDGGNIDNCRCSSEQSTYSENYSLMAEGVDINGSFLLRRGFHSRGKVGLFKVKIGGDLDCSGGYFDNPADSAIEADYANISGNIIINEGFKSKGRISLKNTIVRGTLYHDRESWPQKGQLLLTGFTYDKIQTEDTKTLLDWLKLSTPFSLQPYNHLAEVLKKSGNERDQKRILIESQKEYLKFGKFGWTEKVGKQLLGHIMDFGYSPLKALGYSLVLIAISYSYFDWGKSHQLILPAKIKVDGNHLALTEINPDYPKFNPIIYSIDTFIPIINLQQREYWLPASGDQAKQAYQKSFKAEQLSFNNNDVPDPIRLQYLSLDYYLGCFLPYYFWIHTILGWIFTTLSVAGFTGLVRRLN